MRRNVVIFAVVMMLAPVWGVYGVQAETNVDEEQKSAGESSQKDEGGVSFAKGVVTECFPTVIANPYTDNPFSESSDEPPDAIPQPRIVTPDMVRPKLLERIPPVYPKSVLENKIEGTVILRVIIDTKGDVESAQILTVVPSKSRNKGFEEAAKQAVLKWKFSPAMDNGKPVEVYYNVPVGFKLILKKRERKNKLLK